MTIHRLETVHDCLRIVLAYELDAWYMKAGTTLGFVDWLYTRHRQSTVSTEQLAELIYVYAQAHVDHSARGGDLDNEVRQEADWYMSVYQAHEREVNDLVWGIKQIKATSVGRLAWDGVAALATSEPGDRSKVLAELGSDVQLEIPKVLAILRGSAGLLKDSEYLGYAVDDWSLNELIRPAIQRLDVSLVANSMRVDHDWHHPVEFAALWQFLEATRREEEARAWLEKTPPLGSA